MSTLTSTTSTSRPTLSTGDVGKSYFETDSNKILVWDGTGWNEWNADLVLTPGFSNNNSVNFDGTDDHMTFTSFDAGSSKTLSMWIKLDSISSAGIYLFGSSFYYGYVTANGQIVYIYDGGASALTLGATHAITTGTWTHLAIVGSGGTATLYKDGVLRATGIDRSPTGLSRLGGAATNRFVDGLIDEVAWWNSALTATDISAIYNGGAGPTDLGTNGLNLNPVNWWRMGDNDGGTGTTITDQGSAGNHGTLNNTASPNGIVSGTGNTP
jgi:hypothetical protein